MTSCGCWSHQAAVSSLGPRTPSKARPGAERGFAVGPVVPNQHQSGRRINPYENKSTRILSDLESIRIVSHCALSKSHGRNHMVEILWTCLDLGSLPDLWVIQGVQIHHVGACPYGFAFGPDNPMKYGFIWIHSCKWNSQGLGKTVLQADGASECMLSFTSGPRERL